MMLVQCIMSMPQEEVNVEQPEGQLLVPNNNEDLDLAQNYYRHHRGYGGYGGYGRGGFAFYGGGYGGYGGHRRHHHRHHYWG